MENKGNLENLPPHIQKAMDEWSYRVEGQRELIETVELCAMQDAREYLNLVKLKTGLNAVLALPEEDLEKFADKAKSDYGLSGEALELYLKMVREYCALGRPREA